MYIRIARISEAFLMIFKMTKQLDKIKELHSQIFTDAFPEHKYYKRINKGQKIFSFIFLDDGGNAAGYAIVVENVPNLHLWLGGILPSFRNMGIMGKFFKFIEDFALKNNYQWLTLHTDNSKINLLRMALKHGFDIYDTCASDYVNGTGLCLRHRVTPPLNIRIALTNRCNYKCFFCHGDGVPDKVHARLSIPDIENILAQAGKLNLRTVTFTGGEPLLEKEALLYGIKFCENLGFAPSIKLVSNGMLLNAAFARKLAAFPHIHVNLSLHSADRDICSKITGSENALSQALKAMDILNFYKIPFRLNTVLLKGLNDSPARFGELLRLACAYDIPQLTFLELYAKPEDPWASSHLNFSAMERTLKAAASNFGCLEKIEQSPRKFIYQLHIGDRTLPLSLFRLSCRSGCLECSRHKDETIGPDGLLYPCFMSDLPCGDARRDLYGAIQQSTNKIHARIDEKIQPMLAD